MGENSSGEEFSDSEIIDRCEKQLNEMEVEVSKTEKSAEGALRHAEKRKEREEESSDDGFITVNRRRPKRLIRSDSAETRNDKGIEENVATVSDSQEVCITSQEKLPKPIAMAKLLSCENIKNILRIKYKSPYKVLIQFQKRDDAVKLLDCKKILEMGLRCQLTQEMTICYGIVKGVDLELNEIEIKNILKSNVEVLSIKRLKRLNLEGKWIDCESIRIKSYSSVLTRALVHQEPRASRKEEEEIQLNEKPMANTKERITKSKQLKNNISNRNKKDEIFEQRVDEEFFMSHKENESTKRSEQLINKFEWKKLWVKIKGIFNSKSKFEEKCLCLFKIIWEELKNVVFKLILGEEVSNNINSFING
ncbi:hypothetical protein HW555_013368 [Spodoptera exigua]|uniref:Uncharacterized protein n=1 Tax=Spodoptera exigua TaxID=7107 RepID=A0A835G3M5_SPOEX|nr:hypothetical protein HW555_013368 [Spodoptera exigua]